MSPILTRSNLLAALALSTLVITGCASGRGTSDYMKKFNSLRPGTTMEAVRDDLGGPDEKREGVVRLTMAAGPADQLIGRAPVGTPYRHWIYKRGDSHHHIFFGPRAGRARGWEVIQVRATPASMVY